MVSRLKTAEQAAARRQFEKRMDPSCYRCEKHGDNWFAHGPTNIFQFRLEDRTSGTVLCCSDSGMIYRLTPTADDSAYTCSCKAAEKSGGACKHTIGLSACVQAARMAKELGTK